MLPRSKALVKQKTRFFNRFFASFRQNVRIATKEYKLSRNCFFDMFFCKKAAHLAGNSAGAPLYLRGCLVVQQAVKLHLLPQRYGLRFQVDGVLRAQILQKLEQCAGQVCIKKVVFIYPFIE